MDSQFEGSKAPIQYIYIYIIPKGNMEATFLVRVLRFYNNSKVFIHMKHEKET